MKPPKTHACSLKKKRPRGGTPVRIRTPVKTSAPTNQPPSCQINPRNKSDCENIRMPLLPRLLDGFQVRHDVSYFSVCQAKFGHYPRSEPSHNFCARVKHRL